MTRLTTVRLNAPYLILIGDVADPTYVKTGFGIVHWRPDLVLANCVFRRNRPGTFIILTGRACLTVAAVSTMQTSVFSMNKSVGLSKRLKRWAKATRQLSSLPATMAR